MISAGTNCQMWRIFGAVLFFAAVAIAAWPVGAPHSSMAAPVAQEKCCLIQVMHYGGNLICHDRFESNVMGSGNNSMGRCRVEAMNAQCCARAR
jgi:hypothetical protein